MRISKSLWPSSLAVAAMLVGGVAAGPAAAAGGSGVRAAHQAPRTVLAHGGIEVSLDPATLSATPASPTTCRLSVDVSLKLTGTVYGTASGETVAIVNAPCSAATSTPPGTFADVFRFTGAFQGTVAGAPAQGRMEYAGATRPGGAVAAALALGGNAPVLAAVKASVGGVGSYRGIAQVAR